MKKLYNQPSTLTLPLVSTNTLMGASTHIVKSGFGLYADGESTTIDVAM